MTALPLTIVISNLKEAIIAADLVLLKLEKAQKDLEKPPTHKWKHGDIYKTPANSIMVYLEFTMGCPRTVCLDDMTGGLVENKHFKSVMKDAKFLFNIKEKL